MTELHHVVNCNQVHEMIVGSDERVSLFAIATVVVHFAIATLVVRFAIVTAAADRFLTLVASCRMGLFDQKKTESPLVAVMNDVNCIWDPRIVSKTRTGLK